MIKKRDFWITILLSIVTCGIYGIIFWYQYVEDVNTMCNGDGETTQNYIVVILLSMVTCGIYYYIWLYKLGNRMYNNGPRYGLTIEDNGSTLLLWSLLGAFIVVGPYIAMYKMIENFNGIADRYNSYISGNQQF